MTVQAVLNAISTQLCNAGVAARRAGLPPAQNACTPEELQGVMDVPDDVWKRSYVFTFVRNPWMRLLSAHQMFSKHFLRRCARSLPVWVFLTFHNKCMTIARLMEGEPKVRRFQAL